MKLILTPNITSRKLQRSSFYSEPIKQCNEKMQSGLVNQASLKKI